MPESSPEREWHQVPSVSLIRNGSEGPQPVIPAKQAVSKPHPREVQTPEIVIPAKAGIQAGWSGETPL